ncbi:CYFA0S14e01882g1_1 [Cyberlindnera fabianii]|uniref:CYFA0S14e01882g1_1 n=1 Tax=Cyberlindnera fabianii TaxID=36022 RepID=A0A061B3B5_CYBFA|nr:CYFA0S14e01882g1_1 [Cyberlindnera fabianii]
MLLKNIQLFTLMAAAQAASVVVSVYPQETSTRVGTDNVVLITRTREAAVTEQPHDHTHEHSHEHEHSTATATGQTTAVTGCHFHGDTQFCIDGNGVEGVIVGGATASADAPESYTGCHVHDAAETYCLDASGEEVQFKGEEASSSSSSSSSSDKKGKNCHFHAGVEHCIGGDEHENEAKCDKVDRDYNIPLRIGLLFVILVTSAIGSFGPMVLTSLLNLSFESIGFTIVKQFGTGIVISTAFVHLITHAQLMWSNKCMGELAYESTGTAITMAGVFIAFLLEYVAKRLLGSRHDAVSKARSTTDEASGSNSDIEANAKQNNEVTTVDPEKGVVHDHHGHGLLIPDDSISVTTMEAGIIFHSILIGITLVVAGDSFFITLFIVIIFHQMFEGLALGSRIAQLDSASWFKKCLMAAGFAVVTPVGMAIGTGVLSKFNGNDKSTLIALGTLDSFSAGVLIWTGIVEMWANDWLFGNLASSGPVKTCIAIFSLMVGMLLMSVLGKWA